VTRALVAAAVAVVLLAAASVAAYVAGGASPDVVVGGPTTSRAVAPLATVAAVLAFAALLTALAVGNRDAVVRRSRAVVSAAVGGALVVAVADLATVVLLTGAGTGDPLDPWRALGTALGATYTWLVVGAAAVLGAAWALVARPGRHDHPHPTEEHDRCG
jgi:hypothetical protein